ncbi:response regulator transcription factor [Aquisalimonas asiatica]|uniref:Response regulator receiver domain-containing protein n=1 Tax=Aquisalimonas asiatica TaxID=406100 RepID=A0A1H8PRN9_9GAMM|nr:response regulator [Aquisalimonas asiatica]SEO44610.1 Response regulator receiver domain-containing protein [Aquisalimonas asiatica]
MSDHDARPRAARILAIEDDPDITYLIRFMLERQGYDVDMRADGRAGLDALSGPVPDLILSDIMLPYVDGLELVRRFRAHPDWENVPIVMLTARSGENDIVRAFDGGADDYIVKPFKPDELLARLKRLLKRAPA